MAWTTGRSGLVEDSKTDILELISVIFQRWWHNLQTKNISRPTVREVSMDFALFMRFIYHVMKEVASSSEGMVKEMLISS